MNEIVQNLIAYFNGVNKDLVAFFISMLPLLELRGGLIAASILDIPYIKALLICVAGNIIPIPFILLFITKIFDILKKTKLLKPMVEKMEKKALGKKDQIEKYEFLGLLLFVGIPLPGTGAWTGSLLAALLGIKLKKSIPAVLLGICLAAFIMSIVSYFIPMLIGIK
ncbi:MAG: small multi-drug export protein [Firmicutes bacterium]|nr:small multi-drug export protein [Bacillota bacterium]